MPKFNDGETEWDDMIWAYEGGIMLLIRRTERNDVEFRIRHAEGDFHATATIAQFRLDRIAALLAPGITAEQALYEQTASTAAEEPTDG